MGDTVSTRGPDNQASPWLSANGVNGNGATTRLGNGINQRCGQQLMANSAAVVVASDQTAIPVTLSGSSAGNVTIVGPLGVQSQAASVGVTINGSNTAVTSTTANVANTATQILAANPTRTFFAVTNNNPGNAVYIGLSNTVALGNVAVANGGSVINASGGSASFPYWRGAVFGITQGANQVVGVIEY